jgi:hypothetical protein
MFLAVIGLIVLAAIATILVLYSFRFRERLVGDKRDFHDLPPLP